MRTCERHDWCHIPFIYTNTWGNFNK